MAAIKPYMLARRGVGKKGEQPTFSESVANIRANHRTLDASAIASAKSIRLVREPRWGLPIRGSSRGLQTSCTRLRRVGL